MIGMKSSVQVLVAVAVGGLLGGCGDDGGRVSDAGTGTMSSPTSLGGTLDETTQAETPTTSGDSASASGSTTSDVTATTEAATTANTTTGEMTTDPVTTTDDTTTDDTTTDDTTTDDIPGCKQVDFLFVIDNSVSMQQEQTQLKAAFPSFIDTIKNTLPTDDYHILVADTDAQGRCSPQTCGHNTCQAANQYACQDIFTECDIVRGAGVVHPAGQAASNMPCDFPMGERYLKSSHPDLVGTFQCAASVGLAGNGSERPMDGIVAAVSPELAAPGACNEGFLRDNAILVVTFITDDPNVEDENTPQQTYDALVAAKGGDTDRIVVLGLIPQQGCGNGGAHWAEFISLFGPRGIQGPVCEEDYNAFFQGAVETILDTCVINPG